MTDRELLELAAKAAGYKTIQEGDGWLDVLLEDGNMMYFGPLDDDGDALRLAVKLKMSIEVYFDTTTITTDDVEPIRQHHNSDPYAATRRAIVRAAAEIGKEMKCK